MATAFQSQLNEWQTRWQASQAARFLRWWGSELAELLPAGVRAHMAHAQGRVLMRIDAHGEGGELELRWQEGDALQVLDAFDLAQDVTVQRQQISDLLREREIEDAPRDLLLPTDEALRKTITMPAAAESNLRRALAFEMDRHTPFRADDVYFDYRVKDRDREKNRLDVEFVLTPRAPVDRQLELLAPRGMAPTGLDVEIDGEPGRFNLLPFERRFPMRRRRTRFNLALAGAAVLLLVAVMAQSLWLRERQVERLNEAIEEVRVEARRVQNIRSQIEDASEAASFMMRRRAEMPPSVPVLAEATRIMPDDTFLDRFRMWEGNIQLQGKSDNAQQLIELVNASPLFDGSAFRGSTRMDSRSGKEIFDLRADLAPREGS